MPDTLRLPRSGDGAAPPVWWRVAIDPKLRHVVASALHADSVSSMPPDRSFAQALIVEDILATRDWLSSLVHAAFPAIGVYNAADLASARAWIGSDVRRQGALYLIDIGLPDGSGIDLIRDVAALDPEARLVVTTVFDDDSHLLHAMAAGAHSYLLKDRPRAEFAGLLQLVGRDEVALSPPMARRLLDHFRNHAAFVTAGASSGADDATDLTPREEEVLRLIGRGLTLAEAARVLAISPQTVATHVKAVYRKLGITSRAEAALEAARRRLT